jgi:hypothetical protein
LTASQALWTSAVHCISTYVPTAKKLSVVYYHCHYPLSPSTRVGTSSTLSVETSFTVLFDASSCHRAGARSPPAIHGVAVWAVRWWLGEVRSQELVRAGWWQISSTSPPPPPPPPLWLLASSFPLLPPQSVCLHWGCMEGWGVALPSPLQSLGGSQQQSSEKGCLHSQKVFLGRGGGGLEVSTPSMVCACADESAGHPSCGGMLPTTHVQESCRCLPPEGSNTPPPPPTPHRVVPRPVHPRTRLVQVGHHALRTAYYDSDGGQTLAARPLPFMPSNPLRTQQHQHQLVLLLVGWTPTTRAATRSVLCWSVLSQHARRQLVSRASPTAHTFVNHPLTFSFPPTPPFPIYPLAHRLHHESSNCQGCIRSLFHQVVRGIVEAVRPSLSPKVG